MLSLDSIYGVDNRYAQPKSLFYVDVFRILY